LDGAVAVIATAQLLAIVQADGAEPILAATKR
jgi:hypothetical protein